MIPGTGDAYLDLANTYLLIRAKMVQLNRWVCANISDSTVDMESVQLLLVSPEGHVMSGSNVMNVLYSEACRVDLAWALASGLT